MNKIPPHSKEIETEIISSMITNKKALYYAIENITSSGMFYYPQNVKIYKTLRSMFENKVNITPTLLIEELKKNGYFDVIGHEFMALIFESASYINISNQVRLLKEYYLRRSLIASASHIREICFNETIKIDDILEDTEFNIQSALSNITIDDETVNDCIDREINNLSLRYKSGKFTGVSTGFERLDSMTTGWHPGNMVVIAGRPGMGKTSFMLSMMLNQVKKNIPVLLFSYEMSKIEMIQRLFSIETGVPLYNIRTGKISNDNLNKIYSCADKFKKLPMYIDDMSNNNISTVKAKVRRYILEKKIKTCYIDYLQLINSHGKNKNRYEELTYISNQIKQIGKEYKIPMIPLAQLSRAVESERDNIPKLHHLRDCGAIEQDADIVIFIHRPEKYVKTNEELIATKGKVNIIIAKQRQGDVGTIHMNFDNTLTKFYEDSMEKNFNIDSEQEKLVF